MAAENKKALKKENLLRISWQTCTIAIAMCKLYCISIIQGSMTIYNTSFALEQVSLKMTFTFGLVVIGNIVDNVS